MLVNVNAMHAMNGKKEEGCETVALFSRCPFTSPFAENDPVQCDTS